MSWVRRLGKLPTWLGGGLTAAFLLGVAVLCLYGLERSASTADTTEKLYYPEGRYLREVTIGYREVMADFLWFQTVQYYGAYRKGDHDLHYFRGLVDAVTTLDPHFIEAYYFGSLVASMDQGQIPAAIDLLKRGILANPDNWLLPFQIGFTHYILRQDYERAATWFHLAAQAPDATDFARRFAAYAKQRAGNLAGSIALWRNLYETTHNPAMQDLALQMIAKCEAMMESSAEEKIEGSL
jgi:hypothetical protein